MIVRPIVCRPFIGRRAELAYLQERRLEAASSRGGLVLISGEAGVGKTRLINELRASLAKSRVRIGVGQCLEFAQRPYGPVLDVLARFDPPAAELAPTASKRDQFDAIVQSFERAASRSALLAIVEDVHWADAATLELLTYLSGKLETMRMLVVASYRNEELHTEHPTLPVLAKLARATRVGGVELAPLSGPDLRQFIDAALTGIDLPNEMRRTVARSSEGNPFFTEELLKSAVERNVSEGAAADRTLPTTVRAALMERLRPLTGQEQRVLAQAAIIGRRFDLDLLAETLGTSVEALLPTLQRARDVQLVEEETATVFRFRHSLTRDAIYSGFLASQLRPLHRKIAVTLEALPQERRCVDSLAYHWWAAGDAERSTHYNELAGDAAAAVYAHDDAIALYERALENVDVTSRRRAALLQKIAQRRVINGSSVLGRDAFEDAAAIYQRLGDFVAEAAARTAVAVQRYHLGDDAPAVGLSAMLERLDPQEKAARSVLHLGLARLAASHFRAGEALHHLNLVDRAELGTDPNLRFHYHGARLFVQYGLGDVERVRLELEAQLAASRDGGDRTLVHSNGGLLLSVLGRHDEAMQHFASAMAIARERRSRMDEAQTHALHAFALLSVGDFSGVRTAVDVVHGLRTDGHAIAHAAAWGTLAGLYLDDEHLIADWFDEIENEIAPSGALIYAAGYAEILSRRGRVAEAQALLARAMDFVESPRGVFMTMLAVARLGAEADVARARASLERAADVPAEVVERPSLLLFDAFVARRCGDRERAAEHAGAAVDGFRRLGYPLWEATAREIAGDRDGARAIFARLGALGELRRLDGPGEQRVSTAPASAVAETALLSARESEIAALVSRGTSNLEIGRALSISHKTVEKHLGSIYQKLGFSTRAQLATYVSQQDSRAR